MNLSIINAYLEHLSKFINSKFFNNSLNDFVITVYERKSTYGHLTTWDKWVVGKDGKKEININPMLFEMDKMSIITTLFHEMIHLHNLQNGIEDTSRQGRYHNVKFKEACEMFGLVCKQDARFGWCITDELQDEYKDLFKDFDPPIVKINSISPTKNKGKLRNWLYDQDGNKIKLDEEDTKYLLKILKDRKKGN